ncbi:MAG: CRISPR-associated protein Cas4 [Candidatus Anstonellales archaeon]
MKISGTLLNYLKICETKLWYFSHQLNMEHNSDLVEIGRILHQKAYLREKKEIQIEDSKFDFIRTTNGIEIHEIKKSKKLNQAHILQVKYYLYILKKKGINAKAVIDYPLIRERIFVELNENDLVEIEQSIKKIKEIVKMAYPPEPIRKKYCRTCSYYELCWSE